MVRVLIIAVVGVSMVFVAAVVGPSWVNARLLAQKKACIRNLEEISLIKSEWAKSFGITNLDVAPESISTNQFGWKQHLGERPQCPSGGQYRVGRLCDPPRCSIAGHLL